jgi:hypothetical protein
VHSWSNWPPLLVGLTHKRPIPLNSCSVTHCAITMLPSLSTTRFCLQDLPMVHHCSGMTDPDTPQCLQILLDQPHVEDAAPPSTLSSLVAQLVRLQISIGTPSIGP